MRNPKTLGITIAIIAAMLVGFLFLKMPTPFVSVAAETVTEIGPLKVTNTIIAGWLVVAVLVVISFLTTRNMQMVPSGLQNFVEAVLEWFLGLAQSIAGADNGRKFFVPCCTIFLFVVVSNWMGLLPFYNQIGKFEDIHEVLEHHIHKVDAEGHVEGKTYQAVVWEGSVVMPAPPEIKFTVPDGLTEEEHEEAFHELLGEQLEAAHQPEDAKVGLLVGFFRSTNTDLNMTLALAIMSAIFVEAWGFKALGFGYLGKFFAFGAIKKGPMGVIDVFVGLLEFIAELGRLISFTFRLFGNIFAGEILLFVMAFLMPLIISVPFYGLELFVGLIQALVFSLLTLVFGVIAVAHHGDEEHGEEAHSGHVVEHG